MTDDPREPARQATRDALAARSDLHDALEQVAKQRAALDAVNVALAVIVVWLETNHLDESVVVIDNGDGTEYVGTIGPLVRFHLNLTKYVLGLPDEPDESAAL